MAPTSALRAALKVCVTGTQALGGLDGRSGLGRPGYPRCLRKTTQALCPPKPNEFETPTSISDSRASFGM